MLKEHSMEIGENVYRVLFLRGISTVGYVILLLIVCPLLGECKLFELPTLSAFAQDLLGISANKFELFTSTF